MNFNIDTATERQNLDLFYREVFPAEQLYSWTQHGNHTNLKETVKREYSITISSQENPDGVFSRIMHVQQLGHSVKCSSHLIQICGSQKWILGLRSE
eukprot:UN08170